MSDANNSLPFSEPKQDAMLGHLLVNDRFFLQARMRVEPSWFVNVYNSKIWRAKTDFHVSYGRVPTMAELKEQPAFLSEEQIVKEKLYLKLGSCIAASAEFGLDTITPELTDWLHARIYHRMVDESSGLFNKQKFQAAYSVMKEKIKEIDQTSFANDNEASFENIEEDLKQEVLDRKTALTFGLTGMDRLLVPPLYDDYGKEVATGGLLRGDTTMILAPTNLGKTTCLFTIAAHNILPPQNKSVLIVAHEDSEGELKQKLLCSVLNWSRAQLYEGFKTVHGREAISFATDCIKRNVVYVHMAKAGLTVEDVEQVIRRKQDARASKSETGFKGFDMLIDDYPHKLTSVIARGGHWEQRNVDEYVYNYFVMLAVEYNWHSLLPIQTNREGAKINARVKGYERRLIIPQDVSESWGTMCIADNVISLNRDEMAEAGEYLTYYVGKSRSNRKGWAVLAKSDFAHGRTHDDALGCTWYPGSSTMTSRVDSLLQQYGRPGLGMSIPSTELIHD